ncbi:MAG: hypothetical protein M3139_09205 [Bacteroidota bacterium]|nr:hypothetical protein [Bacteroidota bacterium]
MRSLKIALPLALCSVIILSAWYQSDNGKYNEAPNAAIISVNLKAMKLIGNVDERYQFYNVEMVEVVEGKFWKPYHLMDILPSSREASTPNVSQTNDQIYRKLSPVNLADKRLLTLAKGLAPAYVRVSGTWANATYFQDDDEPKMANAPAGFVNVLTRNQWKGVIDFLKATNPNSLLPLPFLTAHGITRECGRPKKRRKLQTIPKALAATLPQRNFLMNPPYLT